MDLAVTKPITNLVFLLNGICPFVISHTEIVSKLCFPLIGDSNQLVVDIPQILDHGLEDSGRSCNTREVNTRFTSISMYINIRLYTCVLYVNLSAVDGLLVRNASARD